MLPCPWSVTGKGVRCMVYAVLSVCLSRTGFHGHSHSIPGHLWRRVTAGSRSQGRRETRRFTLRSLTPRMSRKCPKCLSPVAARSGFRLRQDLQCSIIWWLPSRGTIYVVHAWELCEQNLRLKRTGSTFFLDPSSGQYSWAFITDIYGEQIYKMRSGFILPSLYTINI